MKKILIFYIAAQFFLLDVCNSQAYKYVYYLDGHLNSTGQSTAVIIGRGLNEDYQFRLDYFMRKGGNLFLSVHYIDSSLKTMQGKFTSFYVSGVIETQGNYLNDQKQGLWEKWDSLGRKTDSTIYQKEKVVSSAAFEYYKNGRLSYFSVTDSLADTFTSIYYDDKGVISSEVTFKGQRGLLKTYDSGSVKLDSLYTREEREASFPGGQHKWVRYLQKNLDPNIPVRRGAPQGTYQVIVKFIVSKDGTISDVTPETHYGYGMEMEVMRLIQKGPKWEPAWQYGHNVYAYRRQTVTFFVESQ